MSKITMRRRSITTLEDLYNEFIKNCKIKNLSPATLRYYADCYTAICKFEKNEITLDEIDHTFIQDYILFLKETTNSISVNTRLRGLRAFLNYGHRMGYMDKVSISLIKADKEVKATYTTEQIKLLLVKPDVKHCSFAEYRNWVMVNWFIATGNRVSTVSNIKIKHLDLDNKLVTLIHTKNRCQQIIPLSPLI